MTDASTISSTVLDFDAVMGPRRGPTEPVRRERAKHDHKQAEAERRAAARAKRNARRQIAAADICSLVLDADGYTDGVITAFGRRKATFWVATLLLDRKGDLQRGFGESRLRDGRVCARAFDLRVGDAVEYGAIDRNSNGEHRGRRDRCGVVLSITEHELAVAWVRGPKTAVKRAGAWAFTLPLSATEAAAFELGSPSATTENERS